MRDIYDTPSIIQFFQKPLNHGNQQTVLLYLYESVSRSRKREDLECAKPIPILNQLALTCIKESTAMRYTYQ
jgi:hypothetical protein